MKRKNILIFLVVIAMGMTACSPDLKEDTVSVETDSRQETEKEEIADTKAAETETNPVEPSQPEISEENGKVSPDPIAGIVEKHEGNKITIRTPEDDMLYYFSTENAQILEGFSTESAQAAEGDSPIAVGDKVEISYRGLIDFDEAHPSEAIKIVVITVE